MIKLKIAIDLLLLVMLVVVKLAKINSRRSIIKMIVDQQNQLGNCKLAVPSNQSRAFVLSNEFVTNSGICLLYEHGSRSLLNKIYFFIQ